MNECVQVAVATLQTQKQALSPNKIYHVARDLGLSKKLNLKGKTPHRSFSATIYTDLKNNPNTPFEKVQDKPILIKLKGQSLAVKEPKPAPKQGLDANERSFHQALVDYLYADADFNLHCKTIYHERSKKGKSGSDRWLHPDIVGVRFEYASLDERLQNFTKKFYKIPVVLYSFELKKSVSLGELREYYFQAVSNSSWANEGYLVACEFDESDTELMELASKLNASFGIGIISLDIDEPAQSRVLFRAKFKDSIDLVVANELSRKNPDFKAFLGTVIEFDPSKEHRFMNEFDKISK
ncbi:HTH domain-containing protein [Campylobacter sp. 19-13652]|uniref:HTH domain-containing protein n=1 Tax=Campylobacter sp. 19-13652 TaxID=2840180 RepID=UPI001C74A6DB|nr:HTH domain-containing protein [Campylobacter sp. 19-13652]BCX78607.1 hypothetical protein LBC_00690 [Campylobacter sp. 19-13652]